MNVYVPGARFGTEIEFVLPLIVVPPGVKVIVQSLIVRPVILTVPVPTIQLG